MQIICTEESYVLTETVNNINKKPIIHSGELSTFKIVIKLTLYFYKEEKYLLKTFYKKSEINRLTISFLRIFILMIYLIISLNY